MLTNEERISVIVNIASALDEIDEEALQQINAIINVAKKHPIGPASTVAWSQYHTAHQLSLPALAAASQLCQPVPDTLGSEREVA